VIIAVGAFLEKAYLPILFHVGLIILKSFIKGIHESVVAVAF